MKNKVVAVMEEKKEINKVVGDIVSFINNDLYNLSYEESNSFFDIFFKDGNGEFSYQDVYTCLKSLDYSVGKSNSIVHQRIEGLINLLEKYESHGRAGVSQSELLETMFEFFNYSNNFLSSDEKAQIFNFLLKDRLWKLALAFGNFANATNDQTRKNKINMAIQEILSYKGYLAKTSKEPAFVDFGTSGWRGQIGDVFTVHNVHKVTKAIIEMMKTKEFLKTNGYSSFEEVKKNGIVVFRDNRFLGDIFVQAAMKELCKEGIKVYTVNHANQYECPTGVGSALVVELGAAGSINFTPSHNPFDFAGIKFNPADGGPADKNLTSIIAEKSNELMKDNNFVPANKMIVSTVVDAVEIYKGYLNHAQGGLFDLNEIKKFLITNADKIYLLIDNMHGSSRGYIEGLLGKDVIKYLEKNKAIKFINTKTDYTFHGIKPEPSAENMKPLIQDLKDNGKNRMCLTVALDPDADRIRFATQYMDVDMNKFGAIAYSFLLEMGVKGGVSNTYPTSNFVKRIAEVNGYNFYEKEVGFKNFREVLNETDALVCFEESDGISFKAHTKEKDAIGGFLMALMVMMETNLTLSEYYKIIQQKYGYYYSDKDGKDLGMKTEDWIAYKSKVMPALQNSVEVGDKIQVGGKHLNVAEVITADGLKLVFEDGSWLQIRASGTESKFRAYYEIVSKLSLTEEEVSSACNDLKEAAWTILEKVRASL